MVNQVGKKQAYTNTEQFFCLFVGKGKCYYIILKKLLERILIVVELTNPARK